LQLGDEMTNLPKTLPGHWETDEGYEMAKRYATESRKQLLASGETDFNVAFRTAMISPNDIDCEKRLSIAKDRIRWLSVQLAVANQLLKQSRSTMESQIGMLRDSDIELFATIDAQLANHGISFTD
jgi:hypothetical protein